MKKTIVKKYSVLFLEFDDNSDKEKKEFEKVYKTKNNSLLNSIELSYLKIGDMSLGHENEANKADFDRIAIVPIAKPICENIKISDGKELNEKLSNSAKEIDSNITAISKEQFKDRVIQPVGQTFESGNKMRRT